MHKKRGFTVVELLITTSVIVIIASMTISLSRSVTSRERLDGLLRTLKSDIKYARQLAINQNRYVIIDFNDQGTGYSIVAQKVAKKITTTPPADNWVKVRGKTEVRPCKSIFFDGENMKDISFNPSGESVGCEAQTQINGENVSVTATFPPGGPLKVKNDIFIPEKQEESDPSCNKDYERILIVVPYGGIKIEKKN